MVATGLGFALIVAAALLIVAAGPRVVGSESGARATGFMLLCAGATLLLAIPDVGDLVSSLVPSTAARFLDLLFLASMGSGFFAMARRISLNPILLRLPVLPVGMAVAVTQGVLVYATGHAGVGSAEELTLIAASLGWMVVNALLLEAALARYHGHIRQRAEWFGLIAIRSSVAVLALSTAWMELAPMVSRPPVGGHDDLSLEMWGLFTAAGSGILLAAGVLLPGLAAFFHPASQLLRSWWALRRLDWLYRRVVAVAPEWASRGSMTSTGGWTTSAVETALYQRIIAIRDASWKLLNGLDDQILAAAVRFAAGRVRPGTYREVAAAAEACSLATAILLISPSSMAKGQAADPVFLTREEGGPIGSVVEEAMFLTTVGAIWKRWERDGNLNVFLSVAVQLHQRQNR